MNTRVLPIAIVAGLLSLAPACPPPPVPPTPDVWDAAPPPPVPVPEADAGDGGRDAGPNDGCFQACANLRVLRCPEADDLFRCLDACRVADGVITDLHTTCLASVTSQAGARGCGSVRCARDAGR